MNKTVDFHHHIIPPEYASEMHRLGIEGSTGIKFPKWDAGKDIKGMDKCKIDKAILSMSCPGVYFENDEFAGKLARISNEFIKETIDAHPDRYSGFGVLPYPAREESLKEIDYIYDTLKLNGIGLLSNSGGAYFGEPGYDVIFQELNKRRAVVYIHPNDLLVHKGEYQVITILFERCLSTARMAYNLLLNDYLEKYPNIRFVLSHGGGGLPVMARRVVREYFRKHELSCDENRFEQKLDLMRNLYFDTAQRGPTVLNSLKEFCGSNHIVFGSDMPYNTTIQVKTTQKTLSDFKGFSLEEKEQIYAGSALSLQSA